MISRSAHISLLCVLSMLITCPLFAQNNEVRARVWRIGIEGNEAYSDIVLKNIIASDSPSFLRRITFLGEDSFILSEDEVRRDAIRIQRFYERRGYDEVSVDYEIRGQREEWKKEVVFVVKEGVPITIKQLDIFCDIGEQDSIEIFQDRRFARALRRQAFRQGRQFEPIKRTEAESSLIQALNNLGYYYAEVSVRSNVDTLSKQASVVVDINPKKRVYVSSVRVVGNERIPDEFLIRETGIEPGDTYSEIAIRNAQRELYNHHFIRFVTATVLEDNGGDSVGLLFRVSERDLRSLQFRAGVGIDADIEGEFINAVRLLRGQVSWTYRNAKNRGERFRVIARASGFDQSLTLDYLFPYVFNTKSSVLITPGFEHRIEPSFEVVETGIRNNLIYEYTRNITGTFSYEFTLNNELSTQSEDILPDSVLNYNVSSFSFSGYYQEGFLGDRVGWVVQPFVEFSGIFGEATFSFQKASLDIRRFMKPAPNLTFLGRVRGGLINYTGEDSLAQNIRFFNGGTSRVRGWSRDDLGPKRARLDINGDFLRFVPVGGRASTNFTIELRQAFPKLARGVEITGFIDGGQVWRTPGEIDISELQFGGGGGVLYRSPIGPIRIEFARKLNPTDADLNIFQGVDFGNFWDRHRLHFSVGGSF